MKNRSNSPVLYMALRPLAVALFRVVFRPCVKGKDNIPADGGAVLAGNHVSWWDCFMVMAGTSRCIHFLAKKEIFSTWFTRHFFNSAGLIPVNRQSKDHDALVAAKEYLENGAIIGVFPESTTIKPEGVTFLPFKIGAVKMASDTGVPIIPFTISGRYKLWGKRVEIEFHEPVYITGTNLAEENEKLRERVISKYKYEACN
ncbi:MAG: 1-acyl-sn-glycerol-3-phosphate acyltransferase [Clostridia bacterium]|nr:1-acyl-sn-glycerol-3-phosphate acyltransferase [Clostridia bacterium]